MCRVATDHNGHSTIVRDDHPMTGDSTADLRLAFDEQGRVLQNSILDLLPTGIVVWQGEWILYANRAFAEQSGYAADRLLQMPFHQLFNTIEQPRIRSLGTGWQTGQSVPHETVPLNLRRSDGRSSVLDSWNTVVLAGGAAAIVTCTVPAVAMPRLADAQLAVDEAEKPTGRRLTPRERQVVEILATGATNRQIGHALKISEHTVKVQLRSIFGKLGVHNRTQLALHAWQSLAGNEQH
jgi:PAS domain S-box-containing protein